MAIAKDELREFAKGVEGGEELLDSFTKEPEPKPPEGYYSRTEAPSTT